MAKAVKTEQTTKTDLVLDKTDIAILRLLQQNARMTLKEIADKVHLSTTPVHERIKWLEQSGVIWCLYMYHSRLTVKQRALNL